MHIFSIAKFTNWYCMKEYKFLLRPAKNNLSIWPFERKRFCITGVDKHREFLAYIILSTMEGYF
jgi:hypothetical protein